MDTNSNDVNGYKNKPVASLDAQKIEYRTSEEDDSDSKSLLLPRNGGMSMKSDKTRRKVQWNDKNGNNLTEVLEFMPRFPRFVGNSVHRSQHFPMKFPDASCMHSDVSDSEDEDSESCACAIM
ncbi:uncharacterized protein G2W53_039288 [Senna tora]|uniref:Uncharacterized protein n=1 Tax=Senna tora TaxID=362788 RepID=A0A834W2P9_9FABA|nr:uncharacterized protein G2W53_039288 [Senna tora]